MPTKKYSAVIFFVAAAVQPALSQGLVPNMDELHRSYLMSHKILSAKAPSRVTETVRLVQVDMVDRKIIYKYEIPENYRVSRQDVKKLEGPLRRRFCSRAKALLKEGTTFEYEHWNTFDNSRAGGVQITSC